ncbi:MAG TPA: DUF2231 domain-containing protein [Rhodanobacteraceae bacterium]|jgi:uncharacterized membrane protein|nr:DUF2231 domain-containing protein [Rhodanobacteraceae bacterium]
MAVIVERTRWLLHPLNGVLLGGTLALFLGALLSDIAYFRSYEIQWNNFSSWLLAGGLIVSACAFVAAIVESFRNRWRAWPVLAYALLVLATWILGLIDELVHAKDAWATMPASLVLSVIVVVLTCAALWIALAGMRTGDVP